MDNLDLEFAKKLEMGTRAEDSVHAYLINTNGFVQDMRHQKHDDRLGPRLTGTEGSLVLPDFVVYNKPPKDSFAVEVKAKNSTYEFNGIECFTVDDKFPMYKRAVAVLRLDYLMLVFQYEGKLYFYRDSEMLASKLHNNKYGKGLVYYFAKDPSKIRY